ncbi:MAG: serine hydrolase domain-containing protein [Planctomycetota bacterium]|jgi:CubicO group peptidase (beta-lactamase class C family)
MTRFTLIMILIAVGIRPVLAQEETGKRKAERIGAEAASRLDKHRIPGASVAVIQDWKIAWARGFGVAEEGGKRPVTAETLFQAASISKPVVALAALKRVQDGKLSLDEDVNQTLKSWKVSYPELAAGEKVTLRRLLSHRAGLTVHGFRGYGGGERAPGLLEVLDGKPPANSKPVRIDLKPGRRFRYSGGGYCVLQQLLIDVSGDDFPSLMRKTILEPLGMKESTYEQPLPAERHARATTGHLWNGRAVKGKWHVYPEMAAAGLWTTPSDLGRFAIEVMKSWSGKEGKLLSKATAREQLSPQEGGPTGLGLFLAGEGRSFHFHHGGSNEGFRCFMVAFPRMGQGAVVMTNSDRGGRFTAGIIPILAMEYEWP